MELKAREQCAFPAEPPCAGSSAHLLEYKNACALSASTISKAGVGIIKMVTSRWRRRDKKARLARSSSAGHPHASTERNPRRPLAHPALRLLPGWKAREEQLCAAKPQNRRRIVVLGAPRVGKTAIVRRFLQDAFEEQYEPTAEDFHSKVYRIRGHTYQIDVLDAPGERGFPARRRLSILTGDIFLLVFSVDDRGSFEEARALREEILAAKAKLAQPGGSARVPTVVCANKADLEPGARAVSRAEACRAFAGDCALFETSAKTRANLDDVFEAVAARGGLPSETRPSRHRSVSMRSYQALRAGRSRAPPCDVPYGALRPLARRPSFGSDLRLVLGGRGAGKAAQRCLAR
ncbi:GTP-binding protein Rhes [Scleropages formosus]|uniref:GTP-binding protein Rhes-like n=1 Tax=Scleropages formosus TaxID=113540 RepID=A0A8C9WC24_SCLFO|nr:GTP-binding protein Rhes-like [Scleropages formosus]